MRHVPSGLPPLRHPSILRAAIGIFRSWSRRRRFTDLRRLDDHMLRDIGLTRDDLSWGTSLPLSEDAVARVRRRMAGRATAPNAGSREPDRADAVNSICPWTGKPVSSAALTRYRGRVVGFGNPDALHEFERARRTFDSAIAAKSCCSARTPAALPHHAAGKPQDVVGDAAVAVGIED
jgi:uncharacterized protein YjiS (DUF1127 family)